MEVEAVATSTISLMPASRLSAGACADYSHPALIRLDWVVVASGTMASKWISPDPEWQITDYGAPSRSIWKYEVAINKRVDKPLVGLDRSTPRRGAVSGSNYPEMLSLDSLKAPWRMGVCKKEITPWHIFLKLQTAVAKVII